MLSSVPETNNALTGCIRGNGLSPDYARLLRELLHGCCAVCCVRVALEVAWTVASTASDLPTGCQPDRFVICFADFTDNCPDIYQPLRQPLRGHSSLLREMFPTTARTLRGCCPDASPDAA